MVVPSSGVLTGFVPARSTGRANALPSWPVAGATGGAGGGTRCWGFGAVVRTGRTGAAPFRGRPVATGLVDVRHALHRPTEEDRQPPNAVEPRFVPTHFEATHQRALRATGLRSARGYPAAVSTPLGADPAVVGPYLASALGDERWRRVRIDLIAAGMSNLTYVVTPEDGSAEDAVILRRPPTGAVLATAHDMAREHRVITALGPTDVPVPRTLHLCTDTSVLGAPFYVMERVAGVHVVSEIPAGYADAPEQRRAIGDGLVDVLADLHAVDYRQVGLGEFGRPEG